MTSFPLILEETDCFQTNILPSYLFPFRFIKFLLKLMTLDGIVINALRSTEVVI